MTSTTAITIRAHGVTRPAPGETVNQDAVHVDEAGGLFVVADGLSGRPGGEVASTVAVAAVTAAVSARPDGPLTDAFELANEAVIREAARSPRLELMAAAVTAIRLHPLGASPSIEIVHAGDCRAYLYRDGVLQRTTEDHLVIRGGGRVITKVLGRPRNVDPDVHVLPTVGGDRWLLCTDGLTKVVGDDAIRDLLREPPDPAIAVGVLLDAARAASTPDDITAVVVDVATRSAADTL